MLGVRLSACVAVSLLCCGAVGHAQGVEGGEKFFLGLSYGPAVSKVGSFGIRIEDKAKLIIPYKKKDFQTQLHSSNFDFMRGTEKPAVPFEKNTQAFRGNLGYTVAGIRVEFEVEREKAAIAAAKSDRLKDGGMPYLLVGDALEYVLGEECDVDEFLDRTGLYDISYPQLETMVNESGRMQSEDDRPDGFTGVAGTEKRREGVKNVLAQAKRGLSATSAFKEIMRAHKYLVGQSIAGMPKEDRAYFARSLATREKGADIVQVGDLSTTTFSANLCYDFPGLQTRVHGEKKLSPYACAGVGSSAVGLDDGYYKLKVSGKAKVGINFSLTPEFTCYIGGVYLQVLGDGNYESVRTERLSDNYVRRVVVQDEGAESELETATVSMKLKHYGLEFGARVFF